MSYPWTVLLPSSRFTLMELLPHCRKPLLSRREILDEGIFQNLMEILLKALEKIVQASGDSSSVLKAWLQLTAECFRCQRNACVQCTKNQSAMRNLGFIDTSVDLIKLLLGLNIAKEESCLAAVRCGLQFLGNIASGNGDSQNSIWKCAFPDLFLNCLKQEDAKVISYACMVLFACLDTWKVTELLENNEKLEVAVGAIAAYRKLPEVETEWPFLIVTDHFLKCPALVEAMYAKLSNQERITFLEITLSKISETDRAAGDDRTVLQALAEFLARCFQENCKAVLKLVSATNMDDEEALVVIRLLDVLCEMTSNNEQLQCLQSCPSLLETVVDVLRLTHLAGKQTKNIFTAAHSMSWVEEVTHPAVGFKAHLIRLIGNLCYRNKENQDKILQLDGIPLILDNCSIDDNNPFLNQWAVYAIRNLTEQNEENQAVIAQMERQGLADGSALKSMGIQVEERDGKLTLKSLKKHS
ncbi:ataxin-10 isoform X2 [Ambystoma mexicanum]|uniref:ataxin-10 isoform X2 n=1 Tax=Ambystoma mexicanum TaxID=8296 RepID=UPI0037E9333E